jgi:predicted DNA-binding protein
VPTFTMRLTDDEHEALSALALLTQRTMADLVREAAMEKISIYAASDEAQQRFEDEQRRREAALAKLRRHSGAPATRDHRKIRTSGTKRPDEVRSDT